MSRWRLVGWSAAALLLLLPLVAMQFTDEVVWDLTDFVVFGAMLASVGLTFEFAARVSRKAQYETAYKTGFGIALLATFLLFWVNGAVGIIGSEDNDANLMYHGIILVAVVGALIARFEPRGMALAMTVTAGAQVLAFVVALAAGWGFTGPITLFFGALWAGSASLFRQAAAEGSPEGEAPHPVHSR
jgi:hypothetical protein